MTRRGPNEGSIYERWDGRWAGSVQIGYEDGRRVRTTRFPLNRERRASPAPGRQTRQRRAGSAVVARWRVLVALILAGGLVAGACSVNSSASNGDRASLL